MRKTENQIWADLNALLTEGLAYWNISGWQIARTYQPTKGNLRQPLLLLHLISTAPVGTEERVYRTLEDRLFRNSALWEQWTFQVDAIKPRTPGRPQEQTALDVLGSLRMWLNAPEGAEAVRKRGYNSLLAAVSPVPEYLSDTEVFELHPHLEIVLFLQQKDERETPSAQLGEVIIKGV